MLLLFVVIYGMDGRFDLAYGLAGMFCVECGAGLSCGMGSGCTRPSPVRHGGLCVDTHDGNVAWMCMGICRVMYRSSVCGHEGTRVGETVDAERVVRYVCMTL